jgi:hypothetical protein
MEGEYSEKQKKINGNFNEAYDLVVEALFGHQNSIRVPLGHHATVMGTDVEPADVVGHDEKNIRLAWC